MRLVDAGAVARHLVIGALDRRERSVDSASDQHPPRRPAEPHGQFAEHLDREGVDISRGGLVADVDVETGRVRVQDADAPVTPVPLLDQPRDIALGLVVAEALPAGLDRRLAGGFDGLAPALIPVSLRRDGDDRVAVPVQPRREVAEARLGCTIP